MRDKCVVCDRTNCLTYFKENGRIYTCNECGAIFSEKVYEKQTFHKESNKPQFFEKLSTKLVHGYISKIYSDEYISYLKLKKGLVLDPDGFFAFILLKNNNKS